jgi:hypothetical protein
MVMPKYNGRGPPWLPHPFINFVMAHGEGRERVECEDDRIAGCDCDGWTMILVCCCVVAHLFFFF